MVSKYSEENLFSSPADVYFLYPIANLLVAPLHNLGLVPNHVTLISICCEILSLYYLVQERNDLASFLFILGYIFDIVDGQMARKYK